MASRRLGPGLAPYVLLAPFILVFGVFVLWPLVQSVVLSTQQMFGPNASEYVGLDNFRFLARDPLFHKAVLNTLIFTAGSVFVQLPIALGLALLLNRPGLRGRNLLRLVFFSPQLVGLVFLAVMATVIFQKRTGVLNQLLHGVLGTRGEWLLQGGSWLDYPWLETAIMPTLIISALWMYVGFNMIYLLAALQNVDRELTEAASIDGAGPCRRFTAVILPAIAPVAGFVVLLSIIGSLQLFELPYILLAGAGPDNRGLTIVTYLYQSGFETGDLGYASAIGWVLALLLAAFTVGQRSMVGGAAR
jgi:ABC-type sugar transport system permease subunit